MSSEKDDKENNIANFSFVGELPTYKVPTHCCGAVKLTTMIIVITFAIIVKIAAIVGGCFYLEKKQLEAGVILKISIIVCCLLFVWTIAVILSIIGIFKEIYYLVVPVLVVEVLFEVSQLVLSILWTIYVIDEHVDHLKMILVYVAVGLSFLIHLYYIFLLISCIRHLKTKQETDEFIARQKMIDEVCEEMWEEEQESFRQRERCCSRSTDFYPDSYSVSEESSDITFYRSYAQPYQPRVTFYEPNDHSF